MKKSTYMPTQTRQQHWQESQTRHAIADAKGSTAEPNKLFEQWFRLMGNRDGIAYSGDLRARRLNTSDIDANGLNVEVKSGCGALAYACTYHLEAFETRDKELCLPGVDWVVYHPDPARFPICQPDYDLSDPEKLAQDLQDLAEEALVATREDFLDLIEEYAHGPRKAGWLTATRFSADHTTIHLQKAYLEAFWTGMESEVGARTSDFRTWCQETLGRDIRTRL